MRNNVAKKGMKFQEPPFQHSPSMPRARSKRHCQLKINNHVGGVGTKFSKQVGNHTANGTLSNGHHIDNTWVCKEFFC